jgi:hypothetical protein
MGVAGVAFHSVGSHYVVLDHQSGLLHDLESPQGCRNERELPIWSRSAELARLPEGGINADEVFERYATAWLERRRMFGPA